MAIAGALLVLTRTTSKSLTFATLFTAGALGALALLGGCQTKPPTQAGTCPEGTYLDGSDCKPKEARDEAAMNPGSGESGGGSVSSGSGGGGSSSSGGSSAGAGGEKVKYDKEMVDSLLKRSAERVKNNCGNATEEGGAKSGPYGETTVSVTVSHTGWISNPTVPAPFNGTAVGNCIVNSFDRKQFPPFGGQDVIVTVPVVVVDPKTVKKK
jgi:hypothetical protein